MINIDALEAKAKAATPGTWFSDVATIYFDYVGGGAASSVVAKSEEIEDAEFIAAATPAIVLDLIRELREARAAVAAEREACADAESDAGRLALELERLLVSNDMPAASRWWDSANEALDLHCSRLDAIRARGAKGCEKC